MREIPLSRCEREFINRCINENKRLDGRKLMEARPVKLYFGSNWGCCLATLGQTRVVANVSCDIQPPQTVRPNEGKLQIYVELNQMAAPHFEAGRQLELGVFLNRQLEKCFKDSRCVDLESLCIVADKKVWNIRVDVNVINHDGNLIDCACIATLAALLHFHRPDVSTNGEEVIIHPSTEKDPLPMTLYHTPVCVSFVTFENGISIIDPTFSEERLSVAQLTLAINSYREICNLYFDYTTRTGIVTDVTSAVSNIAADHAAKIAKFVRDEVKRDIQARYDKTISEGSRLKDSIASEKIMAMMKERMSIKLPGWGEERRSEDHATRNNKDSDNDDMNEDTKQDSSFIVSLGKGSAQLLTDHVIGEGGRSTWDGVKEESEDESSDDVEMIVEETKQKNVIDEIELSGDSEEETTGTLLTKDLM